MVLMNIILINNDKDDNLIMIMMILAMIMIIKCLLPPLISLLATLLGTRIFYRNPTRTLLGVIKPYSLGPDEDWRSHFTTESFPKKSSSDLLAAVKINCSYFPFMLMMLLPTHGEDQQTPQTISPPVMMTMLMIIKSIFFVQGWWPTRSKLPQFHPLLRVSTKHLEMKFRINTVLKSVLPRWWWHNEMHLHN